MCNPQRRAAAGDGFFYAFDLCEANGQNRVQASCLAGCFQSLKLTGIFFSVRSVGTAWGFLIFLDPRAGCNVKGMGGEVQHLQGMPAARSRLAS